MDPTYTTWVLHGETPSASHWQDDKEIEETVNMYRDHLYFQDGYLDGTPEALEEQVEILAGDGDRPLYVGCTKYTKISATIALFTHKTAHNLSDSSFNELIQIILDMLPVDNLLPNSFYAVKNLVKSLDLEYRRNIHACVDNCVLFRKELENVESCPVCKSSWWKIEEQTNKISHGIPAKVLRYFPIIPRLLRMFGLVEIAKQLRCHQDNKMRHPTDYVAWDTIDKTFPWFSSDPRNTRFGLSTHGFNPFQDCSTRYSCWPIILFNYNFPPWLCMSCENMIMTLLIPRPKQPGHDINVYLAPLIEDL